jgi:hypothetical protein
MWEAFFSILGEFCGVFTKSNPGYGPLRPCPGTIGICSIPWRGKDDWKLSEGTVGGRETNTEHLGAEEDVGQYTTVISKRF